MSLANPVPWSVVAPLGLAQTLNIVQQIHVGDDFKSTEATINIDKPQQLGHHVLQLWILRG